MGRQADHIINEQLVKQYLDGDSEALKQLVRRFHPRLKRKIYYYTNVEEPVEDIAQDCWYVIINHLDRIVFQIGFDAWALNIARNKAIDWVRQQQLSRMRESQIEIQQRTEQEEQEEDVKADRIQLLRSSIPLLSSTDRIIIGLFYQDNLSLKEISTVLRISVGTAKSRLFHAREHLKSVILNKTK
ncbi:MAG: sigma-70 family RNA polymerase sigma factor [Bacteroidota bacterium]